MCLLLGRPPLQGGRKCGAAVRGGQLQRGDRPCVAGGLQQLSCWLGVSYGGDGGRAVHGGRVRGCGEQRLHALSGRLLLVGRRCRVLAVPCGQRVPRRRDGGRAVCCRRVRGGRKRKLLGVRVGHLWSVRGCVRVLAVSRGQRMPYRVDHVNAVQPRIARRERSQRGLRAMRRRHLSARLGFERVRDLRQGLLLSRGLERAVAVRWWHLPQRDGRDERRGM